MFLSFLFVLLFAIYLFFFFFFVQDEEFHAGRYLLNMITFAADFAQPLIPFVSFTSSFSFPTFYCLTASPLFVILLLISLPVSSSLSISSVHSHSLFSPHFYLFYPGEPIAFLFPYSFRSLPFLSVLLPSLPPCLAVSR